MPQILVQPSKFAQTTDDLAVLGGDDERYLLTMHGLKKAQLPTKQCPICNRPFTWRKKWAKTWDQVVYCSERCQREARRQRHKSA